MKVTCEICKKHFEIRPVPAPGFCLYQRLIHKEGDHEFEITPYLIHRYTIYFSDVLYIVMGYYNHSRTYPIVNLYKKDQYGIESRVGTYNVTENTKNWTFPMWAEFIKNDLLIK